jgi:hypothetical protein
MKRRRALGDSCSGGKTAPISPPRSSFAVRPVNSSTVGIHGGDLTVCVRGQKAAADRPRQRRLQQRQSLAFGALFLEQRLGVVDAPASGRRRAGNQQEGDVGGRDAQAGSRSNRSASGYSAVGMTPCRQVDDQDPS